MFTDEKFQKQIVINDISIIQENVISITLGIVIRLIT